MKARLLTSVAAALALSACESSAGPTTQETDADAMPTADIADTTSNDAAAAEDGVQATDDSGTDSGAIDVETDGMDSPPDASPDEGDATTSADISNCEYLENPVYLICGPNSRPNQFLQWDPIGDPTCPPYYTDGEARHDTIASLAAAAGCEAGCVFRAAQAVDFIRCDGAGRSGYETFRASGPGCEDTTIYRTADGAFTDLCVWPTYLCYCAEP